MSTAIGKAGKGGAGAQYVARSGTSAIEIIAIESPSHSAPGALDAIATEDLSDNLIGTGDGAIVARLVQDGAKLRVFDPKGMDQAKQFYLRRSPVVAMRLTQQQTPMHLC
jgi:hypothetical protein